MIRIELGFYFGLRKQKHFVRVIPMGFFPSIMCYLSLKRKEYQLKLTKLEGQKKG